MFNWLKKFFPINVTDIKEFVANVVAQGATQIKVSPTVCGINGSELPVVGYVGKFQYSLQIKSISAKGRPVKLVKWIFDRLGSSHGVTDKEERQNSKIESLLMAEEAVSRLRVAFDGKIPVGIFVNDEEICSNIMENLREDAEMYRVSMRGLEL